MKSRSRRRPKRSKISFRVKKTEESLEKNDSESSVGVVMVVDEESKKIEVKETEVKETKVKEPEAKETEAKPAGAEITIPKHLLHKAQKTVIKTAPKQSSCTECGKKHDSHSRECT